jgi:hypothetical protein
MREDIFKPSFDEMCDPKSEQVRQGIMSEAGEDAIKVFEKDYDILSEQNLFLNSMKHTKRLDRTYADTLFLFD